MDDLLAARSHSASFCAERLSPFARMTSSIYNSASTRATLRLVLTALIAVALLLLPSFYYLFRVFKGGSVFGATNHQKNHSKLNSYE